MQDDLQAVFEQVVERLESGAEADAANLVRDLTPYEIGDLFRNLDAGQEISILRHLPPELAAHVLTEVDNRSLPELLELLQDGEIVGLLDQLDSDDAADVAGHLDDDDRTRVVDLLDQVDHEDAVELIELLRYPDDSAGGVMAKEYLSISADQTLAKVVDALRRMDQEDLTDMHYCFVTDDQDRLVGRIPLLKVLLSQPTLMARDVMEPDPVAVGVLEDQERVANLIAQHDLLSLPVITEEGRLVGRVTVDDAIDVISEEATEDVARLAGSSAEEVGATSIFQISRARLPWLMVGLVGQLIGAFVLAGFEDSLRARVVLAFFIPMVMATAGNAGIQTSTIIIRLLVTHEFASYRARRHLLRELGVALLNGLLLGGVMVGVLYLWHGDVTLGLIIGLSLISVVLISSLAGTLIPLALHQAGVDPTVATGPFVTTLNDVLGILVYFGLAHQLLALMGR